MHSGAWCAIDRLVPQLYSLRMYRIHRMRVNPGHLACMRHHACISAGPKDPRCIALIEAHKVCLRKEGFKVMHLFFRCYPHVIEAFGGGFAQCL